MFGLAFIPRHSPLVYADWLLAPCVCPALTGGRLGGHPVAVEADTLDLEEDEGLV